MAPFAKTPEIDRRASGLDTRPGSDPPLYVDLDGTLVQTDTLKESLRILLHNRPWILLLLPFWVLMGRAFFKAQVARRVTLCPEKLPYNEEILCFLQIQKQCGQDIFLATAANIRIAKAVAEYLGFFNGIIATTDDTNYKGQAKLNAILTHAPGGRFDYMGDSMADLPIFAGARHAYLVNPSPRLLKLARTVSHVKRIFAVIRRSSQNALRFPG